MNRTIFLIAGILMILSFTRVDAQSFEKGNWVLNTGIKISIYNINNPDSEPENDDKAASYTIPVGVEYAIGEKFSVGTELGICNYFTGEDSVTRAIAEASSFDFLLLGNFHWLRKTRVNMSSGLGMGLSSFRYQSNDDLNSEFKSTGFFFRFELIDFRIYFSQHFGMYASFGIPYMNFENGRITDNLGSDFSYPISFSGFDIGTGFAVKF